MWWLTKKKARSLPRVSVVVFFLEACLLSSLLLQNHQQQVACQQELHFQTIPGALPADILKALGPSAILFAPSEVDLIVNKVDNKDEDEKNDVDNNTIEAQEEERIEGANMDVNADLLLSLLEAQQGEAFSADDSTVLFPTGSTVGVAGMKADFVDQIHLGENQALLIVAAMILLAPAILWVLLNLWIAFGSRGVCSLKVYPPEKKNRRRRRRRATEQTHILPSFHLGNNTNPSGKDTLTSSAGQKPNGVVGPQVMVCLGAPGGIPPLRAEEQTDVSFSSLTYWCGQRPRKESQLLDDLSGTFRAGKLTAIMGPSGAGKSTLLDLIALRRDKGCYAGNINLIRHQNSNTAHSHHQNNNNNDDDNDYHPRQPRKEEKAWKGYCAYVEQVDQVIEELTVEGNLMFYAHLKLKSASLREKRSRVSVLLSQLRLMECRGVRAGGSDSSGCISGGQKRRLSVAIELLDLPKVIFLDEPTSGLDASSALELIQLLKSIAESGRTIVLTIHQPRPEIFSIVDHLYILAKGGTHAYSGTPEEANSAFKDFALKMGFSEGHYEAAGTADLILDVLSKPASYQVLLDNNDRNDAKKEEEKEDDADATTPLSLSLSRKLMLVDCGGPWMNEKGDKMVESYVKGTLQKRSALKSSSDVVLRPARTCKNFAIQGGMSLYQSHFSRTGASSVPERNRNGNSSSSSSGSGKRYTFRSIADNLKNDLWAVAMLSMRDQEGSGQGQGGRRFQYFFVNLAACFILSSVYWQYHVTSYADMFPLLSAMYLSVISCVMVVQFTHFNLFISEACNLVVDHKRDAYTSLAYFLHCLLRDSFFFCTGAALLWIPASYAINFAGGSSSPEGSFASLLIISLFVNFFGSFIRLVTLIWHNSLHVANVLVGFLLAWCVLFSGLFVYVSALPVWWKWAPWTSPAFYCLRSLFYTIIRTKEVGTSCDALEDITVRLACVLQPDAFAAVGETTLVRTGYSEANLWLDLIALVGFHLLCRLAFGVIVAWRNKNSFLKWCVSPNTATSEKT
jgi:ABC-type multidrug transport system ATPase subunit